ncbi:MAG TPA: hypothetical protein ENO24_06515 [Chloroflexi bacterium]|nr:hypothetical protein [Chloroflexota bacterium]
MRTWSRVLGTAAILALIVGITTGIAGAVASKNYGDVTVNGDQIHGDEVWTLASCDLTISYTLDMSEYTPPMYDTAWSGVGVQDANGALGWMSSGAPEAEQTDPNSQDIDDKLNLGAPPARWDESTYDATGPETLVTPPIGNPWLNYGIWFDRDGVDPYQPNNWGMTDGVTYNTGGVYDVVVTYHAINSGSGTMFATVNGVATGFYDSWVNGPPHHWPVGKSISGDLLHLRVYSSIWGQGVKVYDLEVTGCLQPSGQITSPDEGQLVFGIANFDASYVDDDPAGVQWAVRYNTCDAATNTVWGNVDGYNDPFTWDGSSFHSQADTSTWTPGDYCFVFNPVEGAGEDNMRLTRWFAVGKPVAIDIKPGSEPNAINLSANGIIPVAILGSADFDVNDVDPTTVTLEGAALRLKGKSGNYGSFEDVNGDGYLDLVVHIVDFIVSDGATTATLTGSLWDGTPIEGTDSIVIVHE